jgi:hypothetical protein
VTRRSEQLGKIEASLARLEEALTGHAAHLREQAAATRIEVRDARSSAEAAHAGLDALADMLAARQAIPQAPPEPPSTVAPAAGGGTEGEPVPPARRAPKTLKPKGM